jgi:hypothetical protein
MEKAGNGLIGQWSCLDPAFGKSQEAGEIGRFSKKEVGRRSVVGFAYSGPAEYHHFNGQSRFLNLDTI